jgi:DeoR family transcriptional regulator, fructose operon transcriptional repressor
MASLDSVLRQQAITDLLARFGVVRVSALAKELGVSSVTIRSDLDQLQQKGALRRTRGGAIPFDMATPELPLEETSRVRFAEKRKIGRRAAALVQDGETIIIDVGSTTTELAKALPPSLREVVVVTNGLNIALLLESHPGVSVVVTGGMLRPLQHSLVNPYATTLFDELNADRAFLGCNGVDTLKGLTNTNMQEAEVKAQMMRASRQAVVLADHSKLLQVATARIAGLEAIHLLVTDDRADPAALSALADAGLRVVVADGDR